MHKRLFVPFLLAISLSASAYGYYPLWVRTSFLSHANVQSIAAADFNGDNIPDVVTRRNSPYQVDLLITGADATIGTPVNLYSGTTLTDMIAADANGDGKTDVLIVEAAAPLIAVLLSNGDGTFAAPVNTALTITPQRLAHADFTGDGKLDVLVWSTSGTAAALYAGNGAGGFTLSLDVTFAAIPRWVRAGDIDDDGKADFIAGFQDSTPYNIYYGKGDGTFDTPVTLATIAAVPTRIALADLDADDDLEILVIHFNANTLTVALNTGARTFAAPTVYNVLQGGGTSPSGNPADLAVGDFTDDGHADVLLTLGNQRFLGTFPGNGSGWLGAGVYVPAGSIPYGTPSAPRYLAPADFDGDGRTDVALAGSISTAIWRNVAGDVTVNLSSDHPTISTGQTAKFTVTVTDAQGYFSYPSIVPHPTGTVTLRKSGVDVATGTLSDGIVDFEVPSLANGTHTFTAHYEGDDSFRETASAEEEQNVIAQTSSVSISSSEEGSEVGYGSWFGILVTASSQADGYPNGQIWLYVDGERQEYSTSGPTLYETFADLEPGPHTFYATYEGTETQPPATSPTITQVVKKAPTTVSAGSYMVRQSSQPPVSVLIDSESVQESPSGTVKLYEGQTLLATVTLSDQCCGQNSLDIPVSLAAGTHYLHAVYSGDAHYAPSQSAPVKYMVVPDQTLGIDVWASGTTINARGVYPTPLGAQFRIHRRIGNGAWTMTTGFTSEDTVVNALPGTPYAYYMQVIDYSGQVLATSNVDVAIAGTFNDNPLAVGTPIKALHFTELVTAMNQLRVAAGLNAINITGIAAGQPVLASQTTAIRNGINEARVALGAAAVGFGELTVVRATDVQQMRDAIR